MTDIAHLPHEQYITDVFTALDDIGTDPTDVITTTPDGEQLDGVITFPRNAYGAQEWPDGVFLGWDQRAGWALCTEGENRNLEPLDLDTYANPATVASRTRSRLYGDPDRPVDESWDGAALLDAAVKAWED